MRLPLFWVQTIPTTKEVITWNIFASFNYSLRKRRLAVHFYLFQWLRCVCMQLVCGERSSNHCTLRLDKSGQCCKPDMTPTRILLFICSVEKSSEALLKTAHGGDSFLIGCFQHDNGNIPPVVMKNSICPPINTMTGHSPSFPPQQQ